MSARLLEAGGRREIAKIERRGRIVAAARDLIRETGDTDLSMRSLAERADVSVATAYNLFGSKRAVVVAVLEDERDFAERFARLEQADSITRIFAAHELSFSYYSGDPLFYRTLWRTMLNTSGQDESGLASTERLATTRAIWLRLLERGVASGHLKDDLAVELFLGTLAQITGGALLAWVTGGLPTKHLTASVGYGYASALLGVSTVAGTPLILEKRDEYQSQLQHADVHPLRRGAEVL